VNSNENRVAPRKCLSNTSGLRREGKESKKEGGIKQKEKRNETSQEEARVQIQSTKKEKTNQTKKSSRGLKEKETKAQD